MKTETREESIQHLAKLIKGINIAMLTTVADDGTLRSRPMGTQEREFDGTLWFFTSADTPKVDEVHKEHEVNVAYADAAHHRYVSVSGKAALVRDRKQIQELWKPILKAWFPKGLEDPQLALLRVDVAKAEYWDASSSMMIQAFGFIKALATGKSYEPGENVKLDLHAGGKP